MDKKIYNVLFSGGLDSTYRLCQLALDENAVVQPIYILFPNDGHLHKRPELQREIKAQDDVLVYLQAQPQTKAKFLPIKRIHRDEISKDQRVMGLESELAKYLFGWQYLYIAMLAKWFPNLELCHEILNGLDEVVFIKEVNGLKVIDVDKTDSLFVKIFEHLSFPILGVTRDQMVKDLESWNFKDVCQYIWFCYDSINGKPCGLCDNCLVKINQGLLFLFDEESMHHFFVRRFIKSHLNGFYLSCYSTYLHDRFLSGNYSENVLKAIRVVKAIDNLSDKQLKKYTIEGTLKFGYDKSKYFMILNYKKDLSRKHLFDKFK